MSIQWRWPRTAFEAAAAAAHRAEHALQERIAELENALAEERERLADETLLGDDEQMRLLDRHRSRLTREMQGALTTLKLLREVSAPDADGGSGSSVPFLVELKVLGRAPPR